MVCANTVLETGELRIRVTDNQMNSRVLQLIELMKNLKKTRKRNNAISSKWRTRSSNIISWGLDLTYLLTGSFSKAISFLLVDFSCALKISTPVAYFDSYQGGVEP